MRQRLNAAWVGVRSDRMLTNSAMLLVTSALMAGFGAMFWVVAARLQSPETVGLAGTVVAASDTLALFAQLGLNIALVRTMPRSDHKAADVITAVVVVGAAAALLALVYALLLPLTSPRVHAVLDSPWTIALFCVLVAATAINVLSDNVFLAIDQVRAYLFLNGFGLGVAKVALPFLLGGAGVLGLYGSIGGAALLCGLASLLVIFRHLPRLTRLRPSSELVHARGFAGAGYATMVLSLTPQMVLPLIVVNKLGAAAGASLFVSMQVIFLQNAIVIAIGNSMYAECERHPDRRTATVRKAGFAMAAMGVLSAATIILVAPLLLGVFGDHYSSTGTATLRVLSLSVLGLGLSYWAAVRLRIANRPGAMVVSQAAVTTIVLGLALVAVPHGTVWVAAAVAVGYVGGGVVGYCVSRFWAPFHDEPASAAPRVPVAG